MAWIYPVVAVVLFLAPMATELTVTEPLTNIAVLIEQTHIPNLVSAVILHTRLFDTLGEVVVFALASIGVRSLLATETAKTNIRMLNDPPSVVLCQMGATIAALIGVELALRGHLSPGGGFAAGVSGGTAIGLLLISGASELSNRLYLHYRADAWEKGAVVVFLSGAFLALEEITLPDGIFGSLQSGGWIPCLNLIVALKVTLGSWAIIHWFVRYRGLL